MKRVLAALALTAALALAITVVSTASQQPKSKAHSATTVATKGADCPPGSCPAGTNPADCDPADCERACPSQCRAQNGTAVAMADGKH